MRYFKDAYDGFYAVENVGVKLRPGCIEITKEEFDGPPKSNKQLKTEELAALAVWRKEGMDALTRSWVDISVTDGATEVDRKALLQADITDLKSEYAAKKAEIVAKYA